MTERALNWEATKRSFIESLLFQGDYSCLSHHFVHLFFFYRGVGSVNITFHLKQCFGKRPKALHSICEKQFSSYYEALCHGSFSDTSK